MILSIFLEPIWYVIDCGTLGPPANGGVTFPSGTEYGGSADFTCDPGYDLNGVPSRTCQDGGSWSDADPTCDIKGEIGDSQTECISLFVNAITRSNCCLFQSHSN